jgi:microcystin-dependent protein
MTCYIGEIRAFAGTFAPSGWALCDGGSYDTTNYAALFSLISNTYGGDENNFNVPDLRGRVAIDNGAGTSLTTRYLGNTGGTETVTLSQSNLPSHTHSVKVSTETTGQVNAPSSSNLLGAPVGSAAGATAVAYLPGATAGITSNVMHATTITDTGNSGAHNNIMPYVALNYIICLDGMYPS